MMLRAWVSRLRETAQPSAHGCGVRQPAPDVTRRGAHEDRVPPEGFDVCESLVIGHVVSNEDWNASGERRFLEEPLDGRALVRRCTLDLDDAVPRLQMRFCRQARKHAAEHGLHFALELRCLTEVQCERSALVLEYEPRT